MEYGCVHSFVGRRSTTAETTAAAAHLEVTTHTFFLTVVPWPYPELSEGSVHQHPSPCSFRKRVGKKRRKHRTGPTSSTLHFSFSCGIVYSWGNRTPESEQKQMSVYLIKRKMKKKILVYVPGRYISLFVVALAAGMNSNPSSRERFFLRTANPRGPKQLHTWLT